MKSIPLTISDLDGYFVLSIINKNLEPLSPNCFRDDSCQAEGGQSILMGMVHNK